MSQVRKLLNGSNVPKYKYGHLIIDGIDLGNSEDVYKQFAQHAKLQDSGQGEAYSAWLQQLANGEDVILGADNSSNIHPEEMDDTRAGQRSWGRKVIDDIFNTDRNKYSEAISTARRFTPIVQPKKKTSQNNNAVNFVFVGETPKYSENDATNLALNERLNTYFNWLSDDLWEEDNQFSTALNENQKSALRAWYNWLDGDNPYEKRQSALKQWNANIAKVKAAENGYDSVDEATKNFFANFNIGNASTNASSNTESNEDKKVEEKTRKLLRDAGYNEDLYKILGNDIEIDNEGTLKSKSGVFNLGTDGNIYFNDEFFTTPLAATGQYDALKGLTLYNGALYKNNSERLSKILNASGGFNELIKNGNFEDADKLIQTRFTRASKENPAALNPDEYSTFINRGHRFSNLTGLYDLKDGTLKPNEQLLQYFDLNDTYNDGSYLNHNYKFGIFDDKGNFLRDVSKDDIQEINNGVSAGDFLTYKRTTDRNGVYANKYYEDIIGKNGNSGIRIYRDTNNPNSNVILHLSDMPGFAQEKDVVLPENIAKILMSDTSWIDKITNNTKARENFAQMLHSLGEGNGSKIFDNWWEWSTPSALWRNSYKDVDYKNSKLSTFMSKEQIKELQKALVEASKGNKWDRRNNYFVDSPTEFKNGGKVQYIAKLATGGFAGGSRSSKGITEKRIDEKVENPKNASSLSEIGSNKWTNADTNDLMALGADLASLGLAFVPGANIVSTATGVASSLARFEADRQRGTSGAGAQLGINLAMDAATLLPFIGGAAKSGKVVKAVKSALPVIIKAASVYGLGNAVVTSAKKIANGEKFTVRDVSNVVNGITAGVGIARSGGLGKSSKSATKSYSETFKVGDKDITLNDSQLREIMKASDQPKALREAISAQAKDASNEQIVAAAESLLKERRSVWQRITKKDGDVKLDVRKKKLPGREYTADEIKKMSNLERWWRGIGESKQAYHTALINNDAKRASLRHTTGGAKSSRMVWDGKSWAPVSTRQVPVNDGGWALSSVPSSAGGPNPNNLPAVIQDVVIPVPTRQMQTRTTLNPKMNKHLITRKEGVKFDRNFYDLIRKQSVVHPQIFITYPRTDYQYEETPGTIRNPFYKKGGVIKGQSGLNDLYNPNAGLENLSQSEINRLFNESLETNIENSNIPNAHKRRFIASLRSQPPVKITGIFGDNNVDTSVALEQIWKNGLGAAEYLVKSRGRKDVANIQKRGLLNADYDDPYVRLQHYDTRNPQGEALIQSLNQTNANPSITPNADYRAYVVGLLGKQSQILSAKNDAYRQLSQANSQINNANTELDNKQTLMDQEVASKNRARTAGLNMNLANVDASLKMQDAMSIANAIREKRATTFEELEKAKQFAFNREARDLDDKYESAWKSTIGPKYSEWMNLDQSIKDNYSDINDWLQRADSNKEWWSLNENAWINNQNALNNERQKLYMKYNLSPTTQMLYRQRYMRKGGKVGKNRYKNEPEEDVWINQNKAVHKAVAKLNDNIIKIFLKTLN